MLVARRRRRPATSSSSNRPASAAAAQRCCARARTRPDPRARSPSARRRSRRSRPSTRAGRAPPSSGSTKRQPSVVSYSCRSPRGKASRLRHRRTARASSTRRRRRRRGRRRRRSRGTPTTIASRPEPQSRFTVTPATDSGRPASSAAMRATLRLSSPAWFAAEVDVLDLLRRHSGARAPPPDHERREVVGPHVRERAAVASDRRAHSTEDHRARHPRSLA